MINKIIKEFERFVAKISDRLFKTTKFDTFQRKYSKIYDNRYVFRKSIQFCSRTKNGGTTVHNFLLENSKDFFGGVHSAVSLSCNPNKFKYITIIRDPIDRVYSFYLIQKKFEKLPFHLHIPFLTLQTFLIKYSKPFFACKFINGNLDIDLDEKLFEISNKNLKNFYFVIDFNNLETDLKSLSKKLDIKVANIEYKNSYITQKEKLEQKDVELITKYNKFDIKLYKEYLKSK